ncbi:3510_t:CDS:2 [Gigaspora margarita]|uniref:3510_t:CDS:1 n=1 Tax=Gigaspora margarita TaxID=4874 RepID=A0ABN7V563_GIGMA|nr:3510_t:CDS:2 [Gigaspora margarita]
MHLQQTSCPGYFEQEKTKTIQKSLPSGKKLNYNSPNTLEFFRAELAKEILLEKLTSWLYSETQGQKEAIREEIIRNLTRKKTEQTLYEACRKNNTVQQVLTLWLDLSWNLFYENI